MFTTLLFEFSKLKRIARRTMVMHLVSNTGRVKYHLKGLFQCQWKLDENVFLDKLMKL
jgi:hypothetical protein